MLVHGEYPVRGEQIPLCFGVGLWLCHLVPLQGRTVSSHCGVWLTLQTEIYLFAAEVNFKEILLVKPFSVRPLNPSCGLGS